MLAILWYQSLEAFVVRTDDILSQVKMNALEPSKHSQKKEKTAMSVLLLIKRPTGQNYVLGMHISFFGTPTRPERKTQLQEKYAIHTVRMFYFDTHLKIAIYFVYKHMCICMCIVYRYTFRSQVFCRKAK